MSRTEELSGKLLDYISKHPDAGDTQESISEWWMGLQSLEQSMDEVTLAIESLLEKGLIRKEVVTEDGIFYYKSGS